MVAFPTSAVATSDGLTAPPVWYRRALPSSLILAAALVGLMLLTDPMGFLSTDVGGKVATLEAMQRRGGVSPDLGYWAQSVDPDGSLYPMFGTTPVDGKWVNATTFPLLLVALPLYAIGGAHAAGLVPVAGTVVAALGARALSFRLGGDGTAAFWIVGAASPATIYALDFWEHSWGLALMLLAVAWTLDATQAHGARRSALLAGLAFGAAASLRQEALVYGFVAGVSVLIRRGWSGSLTTAGRQAGAMAGGLGVMIAANSGLEAMLVGTARRTGRGASAASRIGEQLLVRVEEAIITGAGPLARDDPVSLLLGVLTVVAIIELGRRSFLDQPSLGRVAAVLVAIGAVVVVDVARNGLGFIPGLVASTPVAGLAVTRMWDEPDRRHLGVIALVSLPLVWAAQYTGGALPQWGGRYILLSGTLLVVVATAVCTEDRPRRLLEVTAIAGLVVTLIGVAWTVDRTRSVAEAMRTLAERDEPVLVFHDPHLAREGGILVLDERWLAATGADARQEAADALLRLGVDEIGFVQHDQDADPIVLPGWRIVAEERIPLVSGLRLRVTTQIPGA